MPPNPVGHDDKVYSVAFSPDNRYALSGSRDKTMATHQIQVTQTKQKFTKP